MKGVSIRVRESCDGKWWDYGLFITKIELINLRGYWNKKSIATRKAKAMAKRLSIPYDPKILKRHGC